MVENRFSARFLWEMVRNPMAAITNATAGDSPLSRIQAGPFRFFVVTDPDVAAEAMTGPLHVFEHMPDLSFLYPPAGEGVASSPHDKWLRQRRMLAPFFKASMEEQLVALGREEAARIVQVIEKANGQPFDLQELMMQFTLRTAVQHLLIRPFPGDEEVLAAAMQTAMHYAVPARALAHRLLQPIHAPTAWRVLHPKRKREAMDCLEDFTTTLLEIARDAPDRRAPMLQAVFEAEERGELDDGELRDHVSTFLVAAVDSVGSAITWTMWHLARHPREMERAAESVTYAEACALESMRLVPPLWVYSRKVAEPTVLAGEQLRPGDQIVFVPYAVHRRANIWPDPDTFSPERFIEGNTTTGYNAYRYMPFGHGAHSCLGRRMAIVEARTAVHALTKAFRFEWAGESAPEDGLPASVRVAVLVDGGLPMRAVNRPG